MEIITLAQKFASDPSACTDTEIQELAENFNLTCSPIEPALAVGNAYPHGKWDGLQRAIAKAHYERSNFEKLSANPFATPEELAAMPEPSELSGMSQAELGRRIFGE